MANLSAYFSLENADTARAVKELKRELDSLPGITSVSVGDGGVLAVDYDPTGVRQTEICQKLQELGYRLRADQE